MGGEPPKLPKHSGRSLDYWQLRAVETVDPRSYYGQPWCDLTYYEQVQLLAYSSLRMQERAGPQDDEE